MKIFEQKKGISNQWGKLIQIAQQEMMFVSVAILALQIVTAYPIMSAWLSEKGIYIPFWVFAFVILGSILGLGALAIWRYSLPSYFSAFNEQFYKHENPLRQDIESLKADNIKILEQLDNIKRGIQ